MNLEPLRAILPEIIFAQLPEDYTREQLANFLGQCDHESQGWAKFSENLNYGAPGLLATFPAHFDATTALSYARQPEKIANRVYANRMGNGDEASGDGWRYRGAGAIQLTGKINHEAFLLSIGADLDSDIATNYPLQSAQWFWEKHGCNIISTNVSADVITRITHIINGGENGLTQRIERTNYYYGLLLPDKIGAS